MCVGGGGGGGGREGRETQSPRARPVIYIRPK